MKYQLETIPVSDAWSSNEPCPLCLLMDNAEKRHIKYFLGNSVMNPETRVLVNKTGFCSRHFPMMTTAGAAHHLGLIGHTHLQEVRHKLSGSLKSLEKSGTAKNVKSFAQTVSEISQNCLICDSMQNDIKRYTYTAVILYIQEEDFRNLFHKSQGPCLPHAAQLAQMSVEALGKKDSAVFLKALGSHMNEVLETLEADVLHFTRKFDSQNDALEWGNARDAHERTVQMLSGVRISE